MVIAVLVATRSGRKTVAEALNLDTVAAKDTVQEQYLTAVQRNDAAGWRAVSEFFPSDDIRAA